MNHLISLAALCSIILSSCGNSDSKGRDLFAEDFNHSDSFKKNWTCDDSLSAHIEYLSTGGIDGSGCIGISSDTLAAVAIRHTLTGLNPRQLYRMSAMVKCDSVDGGRGAVLYLKPEEEMEQPWNASEFVYGTCDWTPVYMDFVSDESGKAVICCGLGFPWETYNGGVAKGTVMWDDVKVCLTPSDSMYQQESDHLILSLDRSMVNIPDEQVDQWLNELEKAYVAYADLVGDVPYDGRKIRILSTPGIEPGYWALAGNPILWNNHCNIDKELANFAEYGDWCFGIIHEIGHVFSPSAIGRPEDWNWNDEIFANFRMSYALEQNDGVVNQRNTHYKGADVKDYYKIAYDATIGAGKPENNGDALHYTFLRIKDRYGWDVYKKAFRSLYALNEGELPEFENDFDRFTFFLGHVSAAAGEDVVEATYTPAEMDLIRQALSDTNGE